MVERHLDRGFAIEQVRARQHLVEQHSGAVDVGTQVDRCAAHLLRAHVARRAQHLAVAGAIDRIDVLGDAEIDDGQAAVGAEHQVLRLEVAVQHAVLVDVAERVHQLAEDLQCLVGRQRPAAEPLHQVAAVKEFHYKVGVVGRHAVAVDVRDVAAVDALDQLVFLEEAPQRVRLPGHVQPQRLDHQRLVARLARRKIHARHPALPDQAQDADAGHLQAGAERVPRLALGGLGLLRGPDRFSRHVAHRIEQALAGQFLLAQIVVRAVFHRAHRGHLVAGAGEEDDRRAIRALLELVQPFQPVAAAEHVIQDHHVVTAERKRRVRHVTRERVILLDLGIRPFLHEMALQQVAQVLVVVDDQDAHRTTTAAAPGSRRLPRARPCRATTPRGDRSPRRLRAAP